MVCYKNSSEQLQSLCDSLLNSINFYRRYDSESKIAFFVIDNCEEAYSSNEFYVSLRKIFEEQKVDFLYLTGHGNIGYGRAHNLVLQTIDSNYHLILNPDVIVKEDALQRAVWHMSQQHKQVKMLGPSAIDLAGKKLFLCKRYPSILTLFLKGFAPDSLKQIFSKRLSNYEMRGLSEEKATEGNMLSVVALCLMILKPLKAMKGFDERYFLYFEDFDLSKRISCLGNLMYAPEVKIVTQEAIPPQRVLAYLEVFSVRYSVLQHSWMALYMRGRTQALGKVKKVLVTGASGFVGQHLVPRLIKEGYRLEP